MIVYTSDTCAPCSSLKKYLNHKGYEYRELNADEPIHADTLIRLTGRRVVPTTVIEGHPPIIGLNYAAINKALSDG